MVVVTNKLKSAPISSKPFYQAGNPAGRIFISLFIRWKRIGGSRGWNVIQRLAPNVSACE